MASWPPSHLPFRLPVCAKQRATGLPQPTTSRVVSGATCAQGRGVSCLKSCALPFKIPRAFPSRKSPAFARVLRAVATPHTWSAVSPCWSATVYTNAASLAGCSHRLPLPPAVRKVLPVFPRRPARSRRPRAPRRCFSPPSGDVGLAPATPRRALGHSGGAAAACWGCRKSRGQGVALGALPGWGRKKWLCIFPIRIP